MRIALLVPHIFMWDKIKTIFAPGELAKDLVNGLVKLGHEVTLFSPGPVRVKAKNINADLRWFTKEVESLTGKRISKGAVGELIKKKPLTYVSLSRQIQTELVATCYKMANEGKFDLVHVYTNEEEIALAFAEFVKVPILFTHHEPFNFLARYRTLFSKYKKRKFISISKSQQKAYPSLNFIGNVYHGIDFKRFKFNPKPKDYFAFFGRIIKPKGTHLAIQSCLKAGVNLKIAGQHYSGHGGDVYWEKKVKPFIDGKQIQYVGYLKTDKEKSKFLGGAKALLMPVAWEEPFGMVMLESMACGTPVIGFDKGSLSEVVENGKSGFLVKTLGQMKSAMRKVDELNRADVRNHAEKKFSLERMVRGHESIYESADNVLRNRD